MDRVVRWLGLLEASQHVFRFSLFFSLFLLSFFTRIAVMIPWKFVRNLISCALSRGVLVGAGNVRVLSYPVWNWCQVGGNSCSGPGLRWKRGAGTLVLYQFFVTRGLPKEQRPKKKGASLKACLIVHILISRTMHLKYHDLFLPAVP